MTHKTDMDDPEEHGCFFHLYQTRDRGDHYLTRRGLWVYRVYSLVADLLI